MSNARRASAPGVRPGAAELAAAMRRAEQQPAELHRLMLVAASSPWLAAATWRYLAGEMAGTGDGVTGR